MGKRITINIRGIVIAAAWKRDGEISAVDFAGYDEKLYRIADDYMGRQLRRLIQKRIVAAGFIQTENDHPVIYVHHF